MDSRRSRLSASQRTTQALDQRTVRAMPVELPNDHASVQYNGQPRLAPAAMEHNLRDLNHGINPHLAGAVNMQQRGSFQGHFRVSDSPDQMMFQEDPSRASQNHADPSGSRPPTHDMQVSPVVDPQLGNKRKEMENMNGAQVKKRREGENGLDDNSMFAEGPDELDLDMQSNELDFGLGAPKHWTDEEKTKFFAWLMGAGQDDHWNALRASKNACFRECADQLFGGKKTMQALKGAYERGFNVFKQIYAFEMFSRRLGPMSINMNSQAERLKEYERRLQAARKNGCDVGNINARIVDHWHTIGWYDLFYRRWHGDPMSTRPINRQTTAGPSSAATVGDEDAEVEEQLNAHDYSNGLSHQNAGPSQVDRSFSSDPSSMPVQQPLPFPSNPQYLVPQMAPPLGTPSSSRGTLPGSELAQLVGLTQTVMTTYVHLLQTQSEDAKLRLEFLKRKEAREEEESRQRREAEQRRQEREVAEWERAKTAETVKQRTALATELLANPAVDASIKQAAGDYLKRLFMGD